MADEIPEMQITVPSELQTGVYANFALVSAQTPHDFNIDFVQLVPGDTGGPPEAHVVSRVKVAHSFLMPLMQALASQHTKMETKLREIRKQEEGGEQP